MRGRVRFPALCRGFLREIQTRFNLISKFIIKFVFYRAVDVTFEGEFDI